jgi:HTH-type transcriptional regulator/antitoxin HigA
MEIRTVKTDRQHRSYLAIITRLAAADPDPKSAAGARLELLAKLVEDYEKDRFPIETPHAVEDIR